MRRSVKPEGGGGGAFGGGGVEGAGGGVRVVEALGVGRAGQREGRGGSAIERGVIERVLEAANWAPSHGQTEPWRFIVFEGEARRALAEAVVETMRGDGEAAIGSAVQNMPRAARAVGIAGYWTSGKKAFHPKMAEFLGLVPPARCLG